MCAEAPLAVVNTHLFFHPYAPHIRTMHTAAILEEAWALVEQQQQQQPQQKQPALLFCGDLNSDLNDGIPGTLRVRKRISCGTTVIFMTLSVCNAVAL